MKYYYFFYKMYELGLLEEQIQSTKTLINQYFVDPPSSRTARMYNFIYCCDFMSYRYDDLTHGDRRGINFDINNTKKYYTWRNNIIEQLSREELSEVQLQKLTKKIKSYKLRCFDNSGYFRLLEHQIDDYIDHLTDVLSPRIKKSDFNPQVFKTKSKCLPPSAEDDLRKMFKYLDGTVNGISEDDWVHLCVSKKIPNSKLKTTCDTKILSLFIKIVAEKHMEVNCAGHFHNYLEDIRIQHTRDEATYLSADYIRSTFSKTMKTKVGKKHVNSLIEYLSTSQ